MLEKISNKSKPHISETPFHAYEGDEPYIFVSYAHVDAHQVFPELERLHNEGLNIWYDQGISPGNEWTEEIGKALEGCSLFIVFISNNSANSVNVRNEINYALHENKRFLSIYLEDTELPSGLKLSMGSIQAILKYGMDEDEYIFRCNKALRQNGFDITSDGQIKYDVKTTPKRSNKPKNNKTLLIAIGVIAIIAIIAAVLVFSPLQNSNSDFSLQIRQAYVDDDGWCFIWGTFSPVPSNIDKLTVQVEYFDSSGKLIDNATDSIDESSESGGDYLISGKDVQNKTIDKVNVSIIDFNDKVICSDEFKVTN